MPTLPTVPATLVAVRAANHPETTPQYDRVVFEFDGPVPLLRIEYIQQLIADGSGAPLSIAGSAILLVQFTPAQAHNDAGHVTAPDHLTPNLPIVKAIVRSGDFEGMLAYGIGVGCKAYFRILTLDQPDRLVIDLLG